MQWRVDLRFRDVDPMRGWARAAFAHKVVMVWAGDKVLRLHPIVARTDHVGNGIYETRLEFAVIEDAPPKTPAWTVIA